MYMGLLDINRDDILDVRVKKGSNYNYEGDIVLFRVRKGDIIDMMRESGEFGESISIDPMHVWVEDWTDYTVNGYKVYNAVNFDTETLS